MGDSRQSAVIRHKTGETIVEFLDHLDNLDVKLWVEGDRLRYRTPQGTMTPALRAQLAARKQEILGLLCQASLDSSAPESIQPVARDKDLPLSFAQQRLWFLDQLEGPSATYNMPAALRLSGPLDVGALEQAFNEIVRRHEILRTTFTTVNGEPVQVIAPTLKLSLPLIDLQDLPKDEQAVQVKRLALEQAQRPFDLATGPLIRTTILKLADATKHATRIPFRFAPGTRDTKHILLLTMHHIISDGWSIGVLLQELSVLYGTFSAHRPDLGRRPSPLPALPIQYADFAVWQRERLSGELLAKQLDYWQRQLTGAPTLLELPTDHPRPAVQTFKGRTWQFEIGPDLTRQLHALSQQARASLFMTLLAAFTALLSRYSGQDDIVVGSPIDDRNRQETENLLGLFVNTLALRTDLSGNPTFRELLERVRQTTLDAYEHRDIPFEKLVEELQVKRAASHTPLAQAAFALENIGLSFIKFSDLAIRPLEIDTGTAKTDLTMYVQDDAERLKGTLEYSSDLFEAATIVRMAEDFQSLLEAIVAAPAQRLADLWLSSGIRARPLTTSQIEESTDIYKRSNLTKNQFLIWLGHKLQPDVPIYNMANVFTISGEFYPQHLQRALQTLINSSDVLRTVIQEVDGLPYQRVLTNFSYTLDYLDFSQVSDQEFQTWLHERIQTPFDLETCLFDSALIKMGEEKHVWFFSQHHIILDGWSRYMVILPRMSEFYEQSLRGELKERV
jgi:hypothetical protein